MNNTQLLIDAATAAGISHDGAVDAGLVLLDENRNFIRYWNSITDAADAFRLFVKIRNLALGNPIAWDDQPDAMQRAWIEVTDALDSGDEARCRLAITTLAAEMHRAAASKEGNP